jgi:Holliday junction resolvasome RuvABC endonuclease subunit
MKSILALDLGTNCGWAVRNRDGAVASDVARFPPSRFAGGGMRFVQFRKWLADMLGNGQVDLVYFEEVRNHGKAGVDAAHLYGGFLAHLTAYCESHSIPYQGVGVGQVKKSWTGKGNSNKEAMVAEAKRRGFNTSNDNEADALAILEFAKTEID